MRIAELLRLHLEDCQQITGDYNCSWVFYVPPETLTELEHELGCELTDGLHGQDLVPVGRGLPDNTVLMMSRTRILPDLSVYPAKSYTRAVFIPPADLTWEQVEVFQQLRQDGTDHVMAANLARYLA